MTENIYTAINKVMQSVGYIKKEKSQGLNYTFAGEAALIEALRPELVEHGIIMLVDNYDVISEGDYTTRSGATMHDVRVKADIIFQHAASETSVKVCALGEGADSSDKALNKAMTGAYKYALRQTFCIETGDDPERERADRANSENTPQRTQSRNKVQSTANAPKNAPVANLEAPDVVLDGVTYSARLAEVVTGTGERYIDCDDTKLSFMKSAIEKRDTEDGADHMDNKIKLAAIAKISELRGTK